jgi:hypothetical protein
MAEKIEDRLFEIISGMFTACPVILEEPSIMATARILTWGEQLIAVLQEVGLSDDFLSTWREAVHENLTTALTSPPTFAAWTEEATIAFVGEAKRRNLADVRGRVESA